MICLIAVPPLGNGCNCLTMDAGGGGRRKAAANSTNEI